MRKWLLATCMTVWAATASAALSPETINNTDVSGAFVVVGGVKYPITAPAFTSLIVSGAVTLAGTVVAIPVITKLAVSTIQVGVTHLVADVIVGSGLQAVGVGVEDELTTVGNGTVGGASHEIAHFALFNNVAALTVPVAIANESSIINPTSGNITVADSFLAHINGNAGTIGTYWGYDVGPMDLNAGGTITSAGDFHCPDWGAASGTVATRICLENDDTNKTITSLGPVVLGNATTAANLTMHAPTGGNGLTSYDVNGTQNATFGVTSGTAFDLIFWNGATPTFVPLACVISTGACTLAGGTLSGATFSGGITAPSGAAAVDCSGSPTSSFAASKGIVTHC